jgi:hypothetical protein
VQAQELLAQSDHSAIRVRYELLIAKARASYASGDIQQFIESCCH